MVMQSKREGRGKDGDAIKTGREREREGREREREGRERQGEKEGRGRGRRKGEAGGNVII